MDDFRPGMLSGYGLGEYMLSNEIVKVFTKYDVVPNRIIRNEERALTSWEARSYDAVSVEKGLEGVTFVRYEEINET